MAWSWSGHHTYPDSADAQADALRAIHAFVASAVKIPKIDVHFIEVSERIEVNRCGPLRYGDWKATDKMFVHFMALKGFLNFANLGALDFRDRQARCVITKHVL